MGQYGRRLRSGIAMDTARFSFAPDMRDGPRTIGPTVSVVLAGGDVHGRGAAGRPSWMPMDMPPAPLPDWLQARPREEAHAAAGQAPAGLAADPRMSAFLSEFLETLSRHLPAMSPAQAEALAGPARRLVEACTAAPLPAGDAESAIGLLVLERARQIVRQNLAVRQFGPAQLGRLLGVSRSKLYRLFEPGGGVAAFIQRERLNHAMALLTDPTENRSVNTIAAEVGFADHSTFSRAFRRAFGISPSEARDRSATGRLVDRRDGTDQPSLRA